MKKYDRARATRDVDIQMKPARVEVNDKMQKGYVYFRTKRWGAPRWAPAFTRCDPRGFTFYLGTLFLDFCVP